MRALALLPLLIAGPALAQKAPECGSYPVGEAQVLCLCPGGEHQGSVWGNGPYTADSDLCTAAVHAGALGPEGGRIIARAVTAPDSFEASVAHGVTTSAYGTYPDAYEIVGGTPGPVACRMLRADEASLDCGCPPLAAGAGTVWGSGPYTADSDACAAAVHAGVIGAEGGAIRITAAPGAQSYAASTANGVTTSDWGPYDRSFTVGRP